MDCAECARLTTEYERLRRTYVKVVELLFATGYRVTDVEYNTLRNSMEEAHAQSEIAAFELDKHKLSVHPKVPENRQGRAQSEGGLKHWAFR
jgi:hypothetical protein